MRSLSPEEAELWAKVAETIRPLSREAKAAPVDQPAPGVPDNKIGLLTSSSRPSKRPVVQAVRPGRGSNLDGTWDRKLRSGEVTVDRTLDLHGYSLNGAWTAIDRFLNQAVDRGDRVLLLITGHARSGEPPVQRGKIRAAVHDWLAASRHSSRIAAVRNAHPRHGGGGSLYIILRRG